jgi:hypothetical protein
MVARRKVLPLLTWLWESFYWLTYKQSKDTMESIAGCKRGEFVKGMCNLWGPICKLVHSFHRLFTKCRVCAVLNEVSSGTWKELY